jgi:LysM repeat protein
MNNPNPFLPQGSVLEQNRRRSRMKLGVFCVLAAGVCGLTAMLIQGCKKEQNAENVPPVDVNPPPLVDTNPPAMTNPPAIEPVMPTNPLPAIAPVMPAVPAAGTEYVVVKGDTLAKIAKNNHVTLKALMDANPGVQPAKLKVGQKLTLPAGSTAAAAPMATSAGTEMAAGTSGGATYTVKSGDTLTKIARAHGTTVKQIESANNLSTTKIKVGQKLKIPVKVEAAAPAPAPVPTPAPAMPAAAPAMTPAPTGTPAGQ